MKSKFLTFIKVSLCMLVATATSAADPSSIQTITDAQGRKMEVTILAKSATSIKARRASDGREVVIPLDNLSETDRRALIFLQLPEMVAAPEAPAPKPKAPPTSEVVLKTVIEPGRKAFLALPFDKQEKNGICAAASTLNILQFIEPSLKLSQVEMMAIYGHRSGASPDEVVNGLRTLGFRAALVDVDSQNDQELIKHVQGSLDAGRPILAAKKGHAMTLIGYNKPKGTITIWDQRMSNMQRVDGLPNGASELSESAFRSRIVTLLFIAPESPFLDPTLDATINPIIKESGPLEIHRIFKSDADNLEDLIKFSSASRIVVALRKNRRVFIPDEKTVIEVTGELGKDGWPCLVQPTGGKTTIIHSQMVRILKSTEGVFFSKPKA